MGQDRVDHGGDVVVGEEAGAVGGDDADGRPDAPADVGTTRGGVVVGGAAYDDSRHDTAAWALVRFRSSGTLDRSFGRGGILLSDFGTGADWVGALATQRDGKLLAAGEVYRDQAIARYLPR